VVSGWGDTVQGSQQGSDDLLYAPVRLLERQECNAPASYNGQITSGMVCAGGVNADSCQGDSGGPLALTFGTTTYLYGVVSWGEGCGQVNKPGIYTRVPSYLAWLQQTMQ
jgi:secreted trypsin-like serine protease